MAHTFRIEGYAIVSADGMLANADGIMPDVLKIDADQTFFQGSLDTADVVVHGRNSHEGGPRAASRRRVILTRRITAVAADSQNPKAVLWNPAGAPFEAARRAVGATGGVTAIIGGTDVFGLFLAMGYDAFHLSRAAHVYLPGGRPVFPDVSARRSPEDVLAAHDLKPAASQVLDAAAGVTLVTFKRA